MQYRRILLKLSGEALMGDCAHGIDPGVIQRIANEVQEVSAAGVEVGLVIGGGNIVRGPAWRPVAWTGSPGTTWACWRP